MIREELSELETGPEALRKFGLTVGSVFLLLAVWCWWRHKPPFPYLLAAGGPLVGIGLAYPKALRLVYLAWMAAAFALGLMVSTLLLTVFFYLVVTPIGLLARLSGRDFLSRRFDPRGGSYWLRRDTSRLKPGTGLEQQF